MSKVESVSHIFNPPHDMSVAAEVFLCSCPGIQIFAPPLNSSSLEGIPIQPSKAGGRFQCQKRKRHNRR